MREVPFISDWLKEERQEGLQEGRQEGRQKGRQEGRQEGHQEGRQEGYAQARREDIILLLEEKFGVVNGNILKSLDKVDRVESLRMLLRKVSKVETQEEFLDLVKIAVGE